MLPAAIVWNVDPELFTLGPLTVRWYGLLFALGFVLSYEVGKRMFQFEKLPMKWLDSVIIYVFFGTVIGARLGHVFFYDWPYYSQHPEEILQIWQGGLASHGAAIGIILALWIFSHRVSKKSVLWILDRTVVPVAMAGGFIRLGNLMNSEIYGNETSLPWGFIFVRDGQELARHPTQIYEALAYFIIFVVMVRLFFRSGVRHLEGWLLGLFFVLVFGFRFLVEFVKADQVEFEATMALNMGQWLSIPLVLAGAVLMWRASRKGPLVQNKAPNKSAH
jgi:phosphatidylglycerol---prolipoprotein diacylglyceryl transferase